MSSTEPSKGDEEDLLSRLRGLTSEEKSELGKMKCRIDDQARLIMMLKKRNDEYLLANLSLDKHSIQLERQIQLLQEQIQEQEQIKENIDQLHSTISQLQRTIQNNEDQHRHKQEQIDSLQQQLKTNEQHIQQLQQTNNEQELKNK